MVLHHVAQRAGFLVICAATFDADGFGGGDLDIVDISSVPQRLEDAVAEAESQNVLDGFLAEIVVYAIDLALVEYLLQTRVEFARAGQVVPERLLDHYPPPALTLCETCFT